MDLLTEDLVLDLDKVEAALERVDTRQLFGIAAEGSSVEAQVVESVR